MKKLYTYILMYIGDQNIQNEMKFDYRDSRMIDRFSLV